MKKPRSNGNEAPKMWSDHVSDIHKMAVRQL